MRRFAFRGLFVLIGVGLITFGSPNDRIYGVILVILFLGTGVVFERARRAGSVAPREFRRTYRASVSDTYAALEATISALGYRLLTTNRDHHALTFNTGMSWRTWGGQDFEANVKRWEDGGAELVMTGATSQRGLGAIQSISWGETEMLGGQLMGLLDAKLRSGEIG